MSPGGGSLVVVSLTAPQRSALVAALLDAHGSYDDLAMALDLRLGRSLATITAPDGLEIVAWKLVKRAERDGWVADLGTMTAPGDPPPDETAAGGPLDLPWVARRIVDDPDPRGDEAFAQASVLGGSTRPELEQMVNAAAGFQDVVAWAETVIRLAARVCRIEVVGSRSRVYGTGLLVGPDVVLTNHHVVATVLAGTTPSTGARFRFDLRVRVDGTVSHGTEHGLGHEWDLASAPPGADASPGPDELDYAFVRLDGRPGDDVMPWGRRRGWVGVPSTPAQARPGTPLVILQHPEALPVKMAMDTAGVREVNAARTRLTHGVNTVSGSSGAPCFTVDLTLLALHHAREPGAGSANVAVPLAAIVRHLEETGRLALLDG